MISPANRTTAARPTSLESGVRLVMAEGIPWRVLVEAWEGQDGWNGRFVFTPSVASPHFATRQGPTALNGGSMEDILHVAHEVEEGRLRALLQSLG